MIPSLSERDERVLRLLADGPAKVKDLVRPGLSQPTVYRALERLRELKLVAVDDAESIYTVGKAGRAWLAARDEGLEISPELPIPALRHAPSAAHRSLLNLGLCATVARWHAVSDRCLVAFVVVGEPGAFKSTAGEALIALAGGETIRDDPAAARNASSAAGSGAWGKSMSEPRLRGKRR